MAWPIKHGMFGTRLYDCWASMLKRCKGTAGDSQKRNYHDRGIRVCDEWIEFKPFMMWAIKNGYQDDLTIDRKDNDGPYSPDNCKWSTPLQQGCNKRNNHFITCDGVTKTLSQWSRITGIEQSALRYRITKLGWPVEQALTQKVRAKRRPA